ncbi:MAG: hypothetical protein IKM73_00365 [Acidaminococcaceae bacterium]|nr:hypothetical protein [Acidaminococcaceae bacterium]
MKTSFAEFIEVVYESIDIRNVIYIDCEQVRAIRPHLDHDCKPMYNRTDLILGPQQHFVVEGKMADILNTVKSYCKERKP